MAGETLVWKNGVDVAQFTEETQRAFAEFKEAQRRAAQLREAFEAAAMAELQVPAGHRIAFSYRFGQLSIGFGRGEVKVAKPKEQGSLQAWLDTQAQGGHRA